MVSVSFACQLALTAPLLRKAIAGAVPERAQGHKFWPGFSNVKHLFTFGDSYTTTSFNATTGPQPSQSNPLGNPPYPGWVSSNGPNWVDFLTVQYNESLLLTYNLAYGGATVDSDLVAQYLPTVLDMGQQIEDEFAPIYASGQPAANWTSSNSLFGMFIGINDVGNSYQAQNSTLPQLIFEEYRRLVEVLYSHGARNFLFLNVPPVDRSPLTMGEGASNQAIEKAAIADFNSRVTSLTKYLASEHDDTTVFLYDTNTIFGKVLDNPQWLKETAIYKNTTAFCTEYENGTPEWDTYIPTCGIAVNEYFWLNSLHPTYPLHQLLAKEAAELLISGKCL